MISRYTMGRAIARTRMKGRRQAISVLVALTWLIVGVNARADRLELRNGDVITGTIEQMDDSTIVIRTDYGTLDVQRDAVVRGEFGVPDGQVLDALIFSFGFDGNLEDGAGSYLATNNGMRFVADRHGAPAAALRSDGSGTYLSIAPTTELNTLNQFSIVFWVELEDLSSTGYLLSKWDRAEGDTADGKFTVQTVDGNLTVYLVDPAGGYHPLTARSALQALTWHAIALVFSGGRSSLYVDGQLVASDRFDFTSLFTDSSPILVMTARAQTAEPYSYYNTVGAIDDLRLYGRALSPDEVLTLADQSTAE